MADEVKVTLDKFSHFFKTGTDVINSKKERRILPVSPSLDFALRGGIPEGTLTLIRTPKKVGKTTVCMQICANAQKQGRKVLYIDVEGRLGVKNFEIEGLNVDEVIVLSHDPVTGDILAGEQFLELTLQAMTHPDNKGCVIVVDSFSDICASTEMASQATGQHRSTTPKLNANFCRKVTGPLNTTGSIMLGIQHMITNTSGYGAGLVPDGGVKLEYKADIMLEARHGQLPLEGDKFTRKTKGQMIKWQIPCCELGPPRLDRNDPVVSYILYGKGIDYMREAAVVLEDLGEIQKGGSWYSVPFLTDKKVQGLSKVTEILNEHRDSVVQKVNDLKKEMFGVEC